MELFALNKIALGVNSLADIERQHPLLGKNLNDFVIRVKKCCDEAYGRLAASMQNVRNLPAEPTTLELQRVQKELRDAGDSKWFKEVSEICDRLAVLAESFGPQIKTQERYAFDNLLNLDADRIDPTGIRLSDLMSVLDRHEGDLKQEIRRAVSNVQALLGNGNAAGVAEAKRYAESVQEEIAGRNSAIAQTSIRIGATSSKGVEALLAPEEIAEKALQTPERILILSMFFIVLIFALGAFAFSFLQLYQFVLVTGFALTAVIVVNAFYLRTIEKLSEANFLKLMELALLKFFAPLTKKRSNK